MLEAEIRVTLKETIADPQGLTIKHALQSLGYQEVEEVRIGKVIILKLNTNSEQEAEREVEAMCQQLLANPVIEEYSFQIKEVQ